MPRLRVQYTLGQAALLVAGCAIVFAAMRTHAGMILLIVLGPVLPGFILGQMRGRAGIGGGVISCGVFGIAYAVAGLFGTLYEGQSLESAVSAGLANLLAVLIVAPAWGVFVGISLYVFAEPICLLCRGLRSSIRYRAGDSCGPVVWRAFDGGPGPASGRARSVTEAGRVAGSGGREGDA
ncbi:hypothetical protein OJF2_78590 (plasmid) [Aquisphaera giovannonii]|uniref:Uncharacterized protein n=1 Tax=Aquisphaera giovannonii TaxID=406548 RepID=A0A5B9WGD3_9BACT|nr:hypothetical protein [Aquisphaera giovannonii]QEH39244.1 hypothetical protein OJF2_78590 [Aquisphaera giovannonii]